MCFGMALELMKKGWAMRTDYWKPADRVYLEKKLELPSGNTVYNVLVKVGSDGIEPGWCPSNVEMFYDHWEEYVDVPLPDGREDFMNTPEV